jgi:hypothetical protein
MVGILIELACFLIWFRGVYIPAPKEKMITRAFIVGMIMAVGGGTFQLYYMYWR